MDRFPGQGKIISVSPEWLSGRLGDEAYLQSELNKLGLSPAGRGLRQEKVSGGLEGFSGPGCPLRR